MPRFNEIPRSESETETIYVGEDGSVSVTPDGIGFFWFDSIEEAQEEMIGGEDFPIVYLDGIWSDF
jgi:hypothetical protein